LTPASEKRTVKGSRDWGMEGEGGNAVQKLKMGRTEKSQNTSIIKRKISDIEGQNPSSIKT